MNLEAIDQLAAELEDMIGNNYPHEHLFAKVLELRDLTRSA
jgi:hypothetical protein